MTALTAATGHTAETILLLRLLRSLTMIIICINSLVVVVVADDELLRAPAVIDEGLVVVVQLDAELGRIMELQPQLLLVEGTAGHAGEAAIGLRVVDQIGVRQGAGLPILEGEAAGHFVFLCEERQNVRSGGTKCAGKKIRFGRTASELTGFG